MVIKKDRVVTEFADTLEELQVLGMKWHHDHAWFHYFGKTEDVPEDLQEFLGKNEIIKNIKYVLIAEDDEPYKPEENGNN